MQDNWGCTIHVTHFCFCLGPGVRSDRVHDDGHDWWTTGGHRDGRIHEQCHVRELLQVSLAMQWFHSFSPLLLILHTPSICCFWGFNILKDGLKMTENYSMGNCSIRRFLCILLPQVVESHQKIKLNIKWSILVLNVCCHIE